MTAQKGVAVQTEVSSVTQGRTADVHEEDLFQPRGPRGIRECYCVKKSLKLHLWSTGWGVQMTG